MSLHTKSLREIAADRPGADAVFRRWRMDYCCDGDATLEETAWRLGVDPVAVAAELDTLERRETPMSTDALIDHLVERYHHVHLQDLSEAVELAARVEATHGRRDDCPLGLAEHLAMMLDELEDHQQKEEGVLFPMLRTGGHPLIRAAVARMNADHAEVRSQLHELARVTRDFTAPEGACRTWRRLYDLCRKIDEDLREHLHLENNVLFPRFTAAGQEFAPAQSKPAAAR